MNLPTPPEWRTQMVHALHSLKSDAEHARQLLLSGDETGLHAVGESMKRVEKLAIERDSHGDSHEVR